MYGAVRTELIVDAATVILVQDCAAAAAVIVLVALALRLNPVIVRDVVVVRVNTPAWIIAVVLVVLVAVKFDATVAGPVVHVPPTQVSTSLLLPAKTVKFEDCTIAAFALGANIKPDTRASTSDDTTNVAVLDLSFLKNIMRPTAMNEKSIFNWTC